MEVARHSFACAPRAVVLVLLTLAGPSFPLAASAQAPAENSLGLPAEQERLATRYREFETIIERMANLMERSDPEKSALLRQVFARSKHDLVNAKLLELIDLLRTADYKGAAADQEKIIENLDAILELLLTEDRGRLMREERERIERLIADVRKLERRQKELLGQTERESRDGDRRPEGSKLPETQGQLAKESQKLARKAGNQNSPEENASPKTDGKPGEPNAGEEGKPKDAPESPGQENSKESGKDRQEENSKSAEKTPMDSESDSSPGDTSPRKAPGQQGLSDAAKAMERALKHLQEKKNEPATKEQEEAIRELEKTIAELDEILRQLREEERVERLVGLEARCRKMLGMQQQVLEGTTKVERVARDRRSRADEQRALSLSREEGLIVDEADQAILLLREDGTAIAFPEALEQLRHDMQVIVGLLAKGETGVLTQDLCADVIASLEEMIQSLERQIREAKQAKPAPPQGQANAPPPLVDRLAEIKLVRSLQHQVNQRTQRIASMRADAASSKTSPELPEVGEMLANLARRQQRIYVITRGIAEETREKTP